MKTETWLVVLVLFGLGGGRSWESVSPWFAGNGLSLGGDKERKEFLGDTVASVNRLSGWVLTSALM